MKDGYDAIYITRPQVERWTDEELKLNSNLKAARDELARRKTNEDKTVSPLWEVGNQYS